MSSPDPKLTEKVSVTEIAAYGVYAGGDSVFAYMLNSFGTYFYTNVVGIDSLVAGTMMTVCKVLDFITDIIMGTILDTFRNKSGEKARPWMKRSMPLFFIGMILMFTAPFTAGAARIVWAFATYFLATSIGQTMSVISYRSLMPLATPDRYSRSKLEVFAALLSMIISLVAGVCVEPAVNALGGGRRAWFLMAVIMSCIALVFHIFGFLGTKERVHIERKPRTKAPVSEIASNVLHLFRNKYWVLLLINTCATSLSTMAASMIYYVQYVAGDMSILAYMMVLNMVPTMVMIVIAPFIIKKFGKITVMRIGCLCQLCGFIIMWVAPGSGMFIGLVLSSFGMGGSNSTSISFIADSIDYGELKFGVRTEGLGYSINNSFQKLFQAGASLLLGALLAWGGYEATAMVQTAQAITAIKICFVGVPICIACVNLIVSLFLNVEKKYPNLGEQLEQMRAGRQ